MASLIEVLRSIWHWLRLFSPIWAFKTEVFIRKQLKKRQNLSIYEEIYAFTTHFRIYSPLFWCFCLLTYRHIWQKRQIFYFLHTVPANPPKYIICKGTIEAITDNGLLYAGNIHQFPLPDMERALRFKKLMENSQKLTEKL